MFYLVFSCLNIINNNSYINNNQLLLIKEKFLTKQYNIIFVNEKLTHTKQKVAKQLSLLLDNEHKIFNIFF